MKHKGAMAEHSRERMADLMRAFEEHMASCRHIVMSDVYRAVGLMPAKRFWVSDIRATLVISAMMRGEPVLDGMWPLRKEMYREIFSRVEKLRHRFPDAPLAELCSKAVRQPAPKFYLSPGSIKMMICKARKKWKREKLRRLLCLL